MIDYIEELGGIIEWAEVPLEDEEIEAQIEAEGEGFLT